MRLVFSLLLIAAIAPAQLINSVLSGTAQDSSGGFLAGARVTVTEQNTGVRHEMRTNGSGVYRFAGLAPGTYIVEFVKEGFEPSRHEDVGVRSGQEVVINPVFQVAGVATSVTVDSAVNGVLL